MIDINYTRMSNINNCNMKKIECVIMDWAGTSVDYGCFAPVAAFVDSFKQMGLTVTAAETRAHMGVTKIEEYAGWCGSLVALAQETSGARQTVRQTKLRYFNWFPGGMGKIRPIVAD